LLLTQGPKHGCYSNPRYSLETEHLGEFTFFLTQDLESLIF